METKKSQGFQQMTPMWGIRLIQANRIFNLIQQNIQHPKANLTVKDIKQFIQRFYNSTSTQKVVKLVFKLNSEGGNLDSERFAVGLVECIKDVKLTDEKSLHQFYRKGKNFFQMNYKDQVQDFEKWNPELNQILSIQTNSQMILNRNNLIQQFYSQLQSFENGMRIQTFSSYLERLNYCLSIIIISTDETEVIKIYKTFINPTLMLYIRGFLDQVSQFLLKQSFDLEQVQSYANAFTLIMYFYWACKYNELQKMIEEKQILFKNETFKIITSALKIQESVISQQVALCLAIMSKYVDAFSQWVFSSFSQENLLKCQNELTKTYFNQIKFNYIQVCIYYIIKRYQKKSEQFKKIATNIKVMQTIQNTSINLLKQLQDPNLQKYCLILVGQILKFNPINQQQLNQFKLFNNVFKKTSQIQSNLLPAALNILEIAIHKNKDQITNMMINDPEFIENLKLSEKKKDRFFYHFLHIVHLLSLKHASFLVDKKVLNTLQDITFQSNNSCCVASVFSDVLLNTVQQALQNQKILEYLCVEIQLYEKTILLLFKKCFFQNQYLGSLIQTLYPEDTYNYFDKYMFLNVFKILYLLAVGVSRRNKKYAFSRKFTLQIVQKLSQILDNLFTAPNRDLINLLLRQKIQILTSNKIKLKDGLPFYKMVNIILDQMTYNPEEKDINLLRLIDKEIKSYGKNLLIKKFFSLHELEVEYIPVYIDFQISCEDFKQTRSIPHKFEFYSFKTYLKTLFDAKKKFQDRKIKDIIVKQRDENRIIQNQFQYRSLINKNLENKITTFAWEVDHIKFKDRNEELTSSFIEYRYNNDSGFRSMKSQNQYGVRNPNFGGSNVREYTTLKENPSQYGQRRQTYSPNINSKTQRDRSPSSAYFGVGERYRNR